MAHPKAQRDRDDSKERIIAATQGLIQTMGYNGFSFRDIAAQVGIRSASIHYHFPKKADLAAEVVRRFTDAFISNLKADTAALPDASGQLAIYAATFRQTIGTDERMCLCGMLGSEMLSLPEEVQAQVRRFFKLNLEWLEGFFRLAAGEPGFEFLGDPRSEARLLLAALEGALVVTKAMGDLAVFDDVAATALQRWGGV